jgi:lipopolysaccharide transport system ATP-binding protein
MSELLIGAEHVGKKFCRSLKRSLWYGVCDLSSELIGSSGSHDRLRKGEFWANSDISFELRRGETLGLIGHNGAGKTTLLRMLTGLIKPDTGRIEVRGSLQALIALGAGFNPLLTGRENLYLNASILGVPKREIDRRFDEIVAFAGVEDSIDMPVQSYSSGMVVRLGFSVAAHLEPDILLVDEVLSVGDLAFRTKCQVRIQEMKQNGVAIVIVSHNLHTISHSCTRAIALDKGKVIFDGDTETAIDVYRDSLIKKNRDLADSLRAGTGEIRVSSVEVLDRFEKPQAQLNVGDHALLRVHYHAQQQVQDPVFNLAVHVMNGPQVTGIRTDLDGFRLGSIEGDGYIDLAIPNLNLLPNIYTLDAVIFHPDGTTFYDRLNSIATFKIRGGLPVNGTVYLPHQWRLGSAERTLTASSR